MRAGQQAVERSQVQPNRQEGRPRRLNININSLQRYGSRREEREEGHHVPLRTWEIQTSLGEQEEGRSRAREAPEGGRPPVPGVLAPDWVEPQDRRVCSVQSLPPAPARGAAGAGWVTHKSKYLCPLLGECLLQQSAVAM